MTFNLIRHGCPMWLFGYGSLIWRPGFAFAESRIARLAGWKRRFWQGSPDHRGTARCPGRVVTLVPEPGAEVWGRAFRLDRDGRRAVLAALDHREKGGYARHEVELLPRDGAPLPALVYVATADNPHWLGEAPLEEMAAHIDRSHGPSGPNREYLVELARALRAAHVHDPHVESLMAALPPAR